MRYTLLGVVVVAAAAVGVVFGASAPAQQPSTPTTLTFKEINKGSVFHFVDTPPRARRHRPGIGDEFVFTNALADASGTHIGRLDAHCAMTEVTRGGRDGQFVCTGAFRLADGTLYLEATTTENGKTTVGAVTGGSGKYANARGTFESVSTKSGADDTVTLAG